MLVGLEVLFYIMLQGNFIINGTYWEMELAIVAHTRSDNYKYKAQSNLTFTVYIKSTQIGNG
jgi:hypothetical protein